MDLAALREDLDLKDRALDCLFQISEVISGSSNEQQMLEQITQIIPKSFHESEHTHCLICIGPRQYASEASIDNAREHFSITEPIRVRGSLAGTVCITNDVSGFPESERTLLRNIAERISHESERYTYIESLHQQQERNEATLHAIGDAVISTDIEGRITLINPVAEQLTGWNRVDAVGRDIHQVFRIVNSRTGEPVEDPFKKVLETGTIQGLANGTSLISRTGETYQIADSAAPIHSSQGSLIGVIIVFSDVSESYRLRQTLEKSEERFSKAFHNSPFAVTITRLEDGKILEVNKAFTRMFGFTPEEALGRSTTELHLWRNESDRLRFRDELVRSSIVQAYESNLLDRDGKPVLVRFYSELLEIQGEQCLLSTLEDLTSQRATELELRKSRDILEAVISSSPLAIYSFDLDGRVLSWNRASQQLYGWSSEEVLGKRLPMIPGDEKEQFNRLHSRIIQGVGLTGVEASRLHKDGRVIPVRLSSAPLHDGRGAVVGIIGIAEDLSVKKQLENRLVDAERNQNQLEFIINHSPAVAFLWKADECWSVDYLSENIRIFGYEPEQFYTGEVRYADIVHPEDAPKVRQEVDQFVSESRRLSMTQHYRIISGTGTIHWVEDRTWAHRDSQGNVIYLQGIVLDITERQKIQTERDKLHQQLIQSQKMESIGRLAGGVAHDYNNMLAVIMGYTDLASGIPVKDEQLNHYLSEIDRAAKRAATITEQLLTFARKQPVSPKLVDINSAIGEMMSMLSRLIGVDIRLDWIPGEAVPPVRIDPAQLDQILVNLCINAKDAIHGSGTIRIETFSSSQQDERPDFEPGQYVGIKVSDTGTGMDETTVKRLFEPFFTTKQSGKGTGLGLPMVYGIVKQNGGAIDVSSSIGSGSSFTILLPAQKGNAQHNNQERKKMKPSPGKGSVLLVEDERSVRELTRQMLKNLGYTVHAAANPDEAFSIAEEHGDRIHLLLTDIIMPGKNGKIVAQQITRRHTHVRVLYMSGYAAEVFSEHNIGGEDCIHFLQKPFTLHELADQVEKALQS
jgi:PAS domain S-box-containing protein